ncbi:MAG: cation diffusion facilitator family transporter [Planctomycetota bacterium]|jgi:cation diffusion facilitator family transporter
MDSSKQKNAGRQIKSVTNLAITTNLALFVIKVLVGLLSGSIALIADGIHSLSDMATDFAVLLGYYFGSKEPDREHPYGHGRAETFSTIFIAVVLVVVGGFIIWKASKEIAKVHSAQEYARQMWGAVFWVALLSVVVKEALYRVSKKVAVKTNSSALYANAWHHRTDALSSVAVVIGFAAMRWGYMHGDEVAAIVVGLLIILVGVKIIGGCLHELTESAVDEGTIEHITSIINSNSSIRQWHKLRSRTVGREVFLDLHILVDPDLSIAAAHRIAENLESTLDEQITRPVNITVHIEPDVPALRK